MARQKAGSAGARKKPAPGAGVSPELTGCELDARRAERLRTVGILKQGRAPLQVIEVAARGAAIAADAVQQAEQIAPPPQLACQEGCDWCCYLTVGTTVPEVVRIVEYLRQSLSADELHAFRERMARLEELRRELRPAKRGDPRLPCPLLVNHRCTVYPVRPLTCWGCNSTDAGQCEAFLKSPGKTTLPDYPPRHRIAAFVLDGMRAGLSESGLKDDLLELRAALRIALDVPDALERWLAGEPVFAPARLR
jgi:hypothetical protein